MKCKLYISAAFIILCSVTLFTGCKKFVEVDPPKDRLVSDNVFASDATATAAMVGIYATMVNTGFASGDNSSVTYLCALAADETINYSTGSSAVQFYQNAVVPTNSDVTNYFWGAAYADIYAANAILKGLEGAAVSDSLKREMTGEAKFVRAFCHFYLINLFGDVPLAISSDYSVNAVAPRVSLETVYDQIVSDLKDAQTLLKADYSFSNNERTRPNKIAATAMLARVYLYRKDYVNAEAQASAVIASAGYSLVADPNNIFLKNSLEAIWQLVPMNVTKEANYFVFTSKPTTSAISSQLMGSFEINDKRKDAWAKKVTVSGVDYYSAQKYKVNSGTSYTEYSMVLRLGEQYLIRAEARAQQNNVTGAQADLNAIRTRANLANTTATDKASLLAAILKERRIELMIEWGHRWFDLKRTGNVDAVMSVVTPAKGGSWNANWALMPIPSTQITNDPAMAGAQNPGY